VAKPQDSNGERVLWLRTKHLSRRQSFRPSGIAVKAWLTAADVQGAPPTSIRPWFRCYEAICLPAYRFAMKQSLLKIGEPWRLRPRLLLR
jgi:hypothetical protein